MGQCFADGKPVEWEEVAVDYHQFGRPRPELKRHDFLVLAESAQVIECFEHYYKDFIDIESDVAEEELSGKYLLLWQAGYPSLERLMSDFPELAGRIFEDLPTELLGYLFLEAAKIPVPKRYWLHGIHSMEMERGQLVCRAWGYVDP